MSNLEAGTGKDAFREAYAEAERAAAAAAGLTDEQADEPEATAPETGPDQVAEDTEAPAETPAEVLLAGKYKSSEDLERGYLELKAFADRQGNDIGEERALRQAYEDRLGQLEARVNAPAPRQITAELIEQNPGAAAQLAYEQGDSQTLQIAYEQWSLESPAAAATWASEQRANEREQKMRAEFDERQRQLEERLSPIQASNEQATLQNRIAQLPDATKAFLADAETVQALANEFPTIGKTIVTGSPDEKTEAIKALYDIHRGRTADTLTRTEQDVARTTAQEAQAVRDEAYVASSTASQEESLTWEQQEQQRMADIFAAKSAPGFGGALVRPSK